MSIPAVLTAWLVLAAVLATSGVGKVRHREDAAAVASSLGVPAALSRPWLLRAHPWLELLLAAALLALPHPWSVVTAAVTLVVLGTYLLLVCRVVASGADVTCHCFGSVGGGVVDGWTVARNTVLALLGGVVLVDAALGESVPSRIADLGASSPAAHGWWWVAALAVTALVTALVVRRGAADDQHGGARAEQPGISTPTLRVAIPEAPVRVAPDAAPVPLHELVAERRQVLLLLSPGCGPCRMITGHLNDWARSVPDTGFVVAHAVSFSAVRDSLAEWEPFFVQDTEGAVARAFDDPARPWAVVLGTDGRLDSAPAQGYTAIVNLVDGLRATEPAPEDSAERAGER